MSAQKKYHELLPHNKTAEQTKPKEKEQPIVPEEALNGVINVDQRSAGKASLLTTLKSAMQTVPGYNEGSRQSFATDTAPDLLDMSEELPLNQRSLGVKAETVASLSASHFMDPSKELSLTMQQKEAISRRHHLKFITGHYGSGKVTVSCT